MQQTKEPTSKNTFMQAPKVEMKELTNLFFELSLKSCNLKCTHCYIEKNPYKQVKDFIHLDKIKHTLINTKNQGVKCIYLTGGEPMMHPDFNTILRMCLKFSNVTILTNGTMINDKKARFLRKIEEESNYETVYRISLDHYSELKNDELRGRGSFRKALLALQSLHKYEFNPIITTTNYFNEPHEELYKGFEAIMKKFNFDFEPINLKILPYFPKTASNEQLETHTFDEKLLDCHNSRVLSSSGVFSCPILSNDFRARLGADIENYAKKVHLDTEKCAMCVKSGLKGFANDWL